MTQEDKKTGERGGKGSEGLEPASESSQGDKWSMTGGRTDVFVRDEGNRCLHASDQLLANAVAAQPPAPAATGCHLMPCSCKQQVLVSTWRLDGFARHGFSEALVSTILWLPSIRLTATHAFCCCSLKGSGVLAGDADVLERMANVLSAARVHSK